MDYMNVNNYNVFSQVFILSDENEDEDEDEDEDE